MWNFPKRSVPTCESSLLFYTANTGTQNQSVLFMEDPKNPPAVPILDPNTLSPDGTIALSEYRVSPDEKYLAYMSNTSGSDWAEIRVIDLKTKETTEDQIKWVKFSGIAWKDNGFYYSRYDKPSEGSELTKANEYHKVYYHKIGDKQEKDKLIFENPQFSKRNYSADVSDDGSCLIISVTESTSGNALLFLDLSSKKSSVKTIISDFNNDYEFVGKIGKNLVIRTNKNSSNYRLILIDPQNPEPGQWKDFITVESTIVVESAMLLKDFVVVKTMDKACNKLYVYNLAGNFLKTIALPSLGSVSGLSGKSDRNDFYYGFTSFLYPLQIFHNDLNSNQESSWFTSKTGDINPDDYIVKQELYPSDGPEIPMFIVYKKDLKLDGNNPALLYGYGGFNISLTPSFSVSRLLFLENGGIYAMANIRGGGEFGEDWHKAGILEKKQNVFNDFIKAALYLIEQGYTSSQKLAIQGGSNGGLLVGACMTQRPDLFKVALPAVGVMDMLRYHKFTIGWAWKSDYGCSDDKVGFNYLYKYSPLHNLHNGTDYPATLITTADHDDRVVPAHSFKFAATLQEKNDGNNPQLIRIDAKAGHGAGKPVSKSIDEATDIWVFTFYNLGMKFISPQPAQGDPVLNIEDPFDPRKDELPEYWNKPETQKEMPKLNPPAPKK